MNSVLGLALAVVSYLGGQASQEYLESAKRPIEERLPSPGFAEGWQSDGVRLYDEKTVFEYINGEAELYFPYGFQAPRPR